MDFSGSQNVYEIMHIITDVKLKVKFKDSRSIQFTSQVEVEGPG
jgi:hypothetical protein